jgi:hypothetical protein
MNTGHLSFDTLYEHFLEFYGRRINPDGEKHLASDWKQAIPQSEEEYKAFYKVCDYADELAYWHVRTNSHPKIVSFRKIFTIIKKLPVDSIVDFGAGICTDALEYALNGYRTLAIEQNEKSVAFAKSRAYAFLKTRGISSNPRFDFGLLQGDELIIKEKGIKCDLLTLIDVIEHFYDPFIALDRLLINRPPYFIFTQAFKVHEEEKGGHPQHTDYDIHAVYAHLRDKLGYTKVQLKGVAFPPNLWTITDMKILNIKGEE